MKYSLVAAALAAPVVFAAPAKRQTTNIDTTVLQFALTLEHLENVFYSDALQKFSLADFENAGYDAAYYQNLQYIAYDERSHVDFLSGALQAAGQTPTAQCTYTFPYTDVGSFITLSSIIEGVGTSAYLGGAPLITSKDYLTAAGSILVTEALHTSLQRVAVNEVASANPYGTPLDPTSVYTLAAAFIVSCPATNPVLPFTPFPALTLTAAVAKRDGEDGSDYYYESGPDEEWGGYETSSEEYDGGWQPGPGDYEGGYQPGPDGHDGGYQPGSGHNGGSKPSAMNTVYAAGQTVYFTGATAVPAGSFLTFVSGLQVVSVPASISGTSIGGSVPAAAMGQTYVFVTSAAAVGNKLDGTTVLFGPAILEVAPATL